MSKKYIKLSFTDAKLFPKNPKTKDIVTNVAVSSSGKLIVEHSKRSKQKITSFKEPITVHQLSNMLHTLVGERPVPSFRKVFYKADKSIFNIANQSLLKITTPKQVKIVNGEEVETFISEMIRLDKSSWNSWSKPKTIQWFKVKKYLGEDFDKFIETINNDIGYDVLNEPFENLFNRFPKYDLQLDSTIKFLEEKKRTPIINILTSWTEPSEIEWSQIQNHLGNEFNEFKKTLSEEVGYDISKESFGDLFNIYKKDKLELGNTIRYLKDIKKTPIIDFLKNKEIDRTEITKNKALAECVNSGVDMVYVLNGEILIPYEQSFVDRLVRSTTTILDGGYVSIVGVFYEDELHDTDRFTLVSEISDEKY